jgi:IS30 family transposase
MGRRGPQPEYAKREEFARLIAEGVTSQHASRIVGINSRTGKRWRNGRKVKSGGRMLDLPPVINPARRSGTRRATSPKTNASSRGL